MLFALGAVSTALDALQSLTSQKTSSTQQGGSTHGATNPFSVDDANGAANWAKSSVNAGHRPQISPETMSALIAAQGQTSTSASTATGSVSSTSTSPQDALKNLFSKIDADGDGKITKSEFENALGAGGTNLAQADKVFAKLDANSDGSVSLDEMSKALKGGHRHGRHAQAASGSGSGGAASSDPLMQALDSSKSTSVTNGDGSTTTTVTYSDGFKVSSTSGGKSSAQSYAVSSYNLLDDLIKKNPGSVTRFDPNSVLSVSV